MQPIDGRVGGCEGPPITILETGLQEGLGNLVSACGKSFQAAAAGPQEREEWAGAAQTERGKPLSAGGLVQAIEIAFQ